MKFQETIRVLDSHGIVPLASGIQPLKFEDQSGLETLVVHTLNYGYCMSAMIVQVNAKISRLGSKVAKVKLKKIGGSLYKR